MNGTVQVYLANQKAFITTGYRSGICVSTSCRRHIRSVDVVMDGIEYFWKCTNPRALEEVLYANRPKKFDEKTGRPIIVRFADYVKYTNVAPDEFYMLETGDNHVKTAKKLNKSLIRAWLQSSNGELKRIVSNTAEGEESIMGERIPYFDAGKAYVVSYGADKGAFAAESMPMEDIKHIAEVCEEILATEAKQLGIYLSEWLGKTFVPTMKAYISAKEADENEIEEKRVRYAQEVNAVNHLLEDRISEFNWSDDGQFGFDCGFLYLGFTDERMRDMERFLRYAEVDVPAIKLPFYAQSLTLKRREFEKAKAIAAESGYDISIVGSEWD